MSVPTNTRYTAYGLGIGSGVLCTGSCFALAKSENTTHSVFFGIVGLASGAFAVGCGTAFMRAGPSTTPRQFVQDAASDAGYAAYGITTVVAKEIGGAVLDGATTALKNETEKKVRGFINGKNEDKPEKK